MLSLNVKVGVICVLLIQVSLADVSHYFAPEFDYFQQQQQQQQQQLQHYSQQQYPFHLALQPPGLYGAPQQTPQPVYPSVAAKPAVQPSTPSPVAPVATTTEFIFPEVVENRSAKDHRNFIPLQHNYLPPSSLEVERPPNYESPRPPQVGYLPPPMSGSLLFSDGYHYAKPTTSTTTTTTTTTLRPIVVVEQPEELPGGDPFVGPPSHQGYDYNAPVAPTRPPSTPAPAYLPPSSNSVGQMGYDYNAPARPPSLPPISTPAPAYLPPASNVVEHADPQIPPLRLHIQEMRCLQQQQSGYFRSVLKVDSFISAAPNIDNDSYDKRCELKLSRSFVVVDIAEADFQKCGVRACGRDLCLRLRFPAIRGMRTGSDAILTLHCKTQDRVAVKTHALKMGVANDVQARSIGTYAHGGTQNSFRTHIELLRRTGNGFTRHLDTNAAVQLGEELLLRAHVLAGDGWNHTKLTDISLQRISPSGEVLNTANLITSHGCLNPSMQSICTAAPTFDPPLGHKLGFKAVMFQGMRSGEELVVSMRITACLEEQDCNINLHECNAVGGNNYGRRKRNTAATVKQLEEKPAANSTEVSEISRISFRVIMQDDERIADDTTNGRDEIVRQDMEMLMMPSSLIMIGVLGFVLLLISLGIFASVKLRK